MSRYIRPFFVFAEISTVTRPRAHPAHIPRRGPFPDQTNGSGPATPSEARPVRAKTQQKIDAKNKSVISEIFFQSPLDKSDITDYNKHVIGNNRTPHHDRPVHHGVTRVTPADIKIAAPVIATPGQRKGGKDHDPYTRNLVLPWSSL